VYIITNMSTMINIPGRFISLQFVFLAGKLNRVGKYARRIYL
jgi:hypothetical protein